MKAIFGVIRTKFPGILLAVSIFMGNAHAQLCQGSLGDPLVNITFGAGSNPGPALAAATTSYQYVPNDCPGDGFYTVRSNTSNCFSNSWHGLASDHTGDPNGYFMLINASYQPSAFYLDTVKGLCSGTTYEFAAWIINVLRTTACNGTGIQPNLTFTIEGTDGTILKTYNTNNIPSTTSPTWQQFGFFFTTPPTASDIVLRIFNNSVGGCGNDIGLDDITFRPCGPQLTSSIVGDGTSVTMCENTARSFTFQCTVSAGFNDPSYQWQQSLNGGAWTDIPGATTTSLTRNFPATTAPGIYAYRLSAAETGNMASAKCRVVSLPVTVTIVANPVTTATSNSPVCERNTLSLTATGGTTYQWNGVGGFSATGANVSIYNVQPSHVGKYYVTVANDAGCTHLDSVTIAVNTNPVSSTSIDAATICEGQDIQLSSDGGDTYQWVPSSGLSSSTMSDPVASPSDTTVYMVIVTNQAGCRDTSEITINVMERPRADAGPDQTILKGDAVQLQGVATGQNISFVWSPTTFLDDPTSIQPIARPDHDTSYILTVSSPQCGVAEDTMHVFVYHDIYVPSAFTPNGNGLNDTWVIPALRAFPGFVVTVYNRYGELVFRTVDSDKPWDGTHKGIAQPSGVYVYMIDLKQSGRLLKGTVTIIR